jgi:hypothetical protein
MNSLRISGNVLDSGCLFFSRLFLLLAQPGMVEVRTVFIGRPTSGRHTP